MKHISLFILALTFAVTASAQYVQEPLHRKGTHLASSAGKLTEAEMSAVLADIDGVDYNDQWKKVSARRNTGLGMTIGGAVVGVAGGVVTMAGLGTSLIGAAVGGTIGSIGGKESASEAANEGAEAGTPLITAGIIAGLAGVTSFCVGLPMLISKNKKLNGIVNQYNGSQSKTSVALGSTRNGFGVQVIF